MATTKPTSGSDDARYQSYLAQMERDQDATIQEKQEEHKEKLGRVISTNEQQQDQVRKDYDVKISSEAESLDRKLNLIRDRNTLLVNSERETGEHEAEKMHAMYQAKIEQEKKIGDTQLSKLQQYYKKASDELGNQFERDRAKRERAEKV